MSKPSEFQSDIKNILEQARGKARSAVNGAMGEPDQSILYTLCRKSNWSHMGALFTMDPRTAVHSSSEQCSDGSSPYRTCCRASCSGQDAALRGITLASMSKRRREARQRRSLCKPCE